MPEVVARRVAEELAVGDSACLADYAQREATHREHAGEIEREYAHRDFADLSGRAELPEWVDARAWATAERPSVLFDLATARLIEALGAACGRQRAGQNGSPQRRIARLYRMLCDATTGEQQRSLRKLCPWGYGQGDHAISAAAAAFP